MIAFFHSPQFKRTEKETWNIITATSSFIGRIINFIFIMRCLIVGMILELVKVKALFECLDFNRK